MRVEKAPAEVRLPLPYDYLLNNNTISGLKVADISRVSGYISIYVLYEEKASCDYFFKTDLLLRINITIYTLYSQGGFQHCDSQSITFATKIGSLSKYARFCYHLSTYNFYAVSNDLQMSLIVRFPSEYIFNCSYSVIDTNMLFTDLELNKNAQKALERENILPFPTYNFKSTFIFSFFFKKRK